MDIKNRFSVGVLFNPLLTEILCVLKRPGTRTGSGSDQGGLVNCPGGKVENYDLAPVVPDGRFGSGSLMGEAVTAGIAVGRTHKNCVKREIAEETGLSDLDLRLFMIMTFRQTGGSCHFFADQTDLGQAKTCDGEMIFQAPVADVITGQVKIQFGIEIVSTSTVPDLPTIVILARQFLRGGTGFPWAVWK